MSTKSQEEEGSSIENQRHIGQTLCDKLGMEYVELNEGGFTSMVRSEEQLLKSPRPKFEELKTRNQDWSNNECLVLQSK